jgi:Cu+-exporting ATPase
VLVRNAEALERLEKVDTVVVDKTGTLTEGKPRATAVLTAGGVSEAEVLKCAAALEQASEHPLAVAVVNAARARGLKRSAVSGFQGLTGLGVSGRVEGRSVLVGSARLLQSNGVDLRSLDASLAELAPKQSAVYVAIDGTPAGVIVVEDPVKASAAEAIRYLHQEGLRVVMLTGDIRATAEAVGKAVGIDEAIAELQPQQKREVIARLQREGRVVAMAGDGINDAPALAEASVGIAMGTGADVAIESAGITLVGGDLAGIVRARRLSRATMRNIRQNLFLAFVYNAVGVPVAAGALYPIIGLLISPIWASAAMTFSSVSVIANALRLRSAAL